MNGKFPRGSHSVLSNHKEKLLFPFWLAQSNKYRKIRQWVFLPDLSMRRLAMIRAPNTFGKIPDTFAIRLQRKVYVLHLAVKNFDLLKNQINFKPMAVALTAKAYLYIPLSVNSKLVRQYL